MNFVVFGAGALGLGFLGPELTEGGSVCFVDVAAKADLLDALAREGAYWFNETGLLMCRRRVQGVTAVRAEREAAVLDALDKADLVFTAVGQTNLPAVAPVLALAAVRRDVRRPLRVLCSENGVEVARRLAALVREAAGQDLEGRLITGDTVMGRMCKTVPAGADLVPPVEGLDWAVVAESYHGIPVEAHVVEGVDGLPDSIEPHEPPAFRAAEDTKMLCHNGPHGILGALAWLEGLDSFAQLRQRKALMEFGRALLFQEAVPALLRRHGAACRRNALLNYCDWILRRLTCPVFDDPVGRAIRGMMRKLEPWERLVYGLRTVAEQGIRPRLFARGLAAAVLVARRSGQTDMSARLVLTSHCDLCPVRDARLLTLVEEELAGLEAQFPGRGHSGPAAGGGAD